MTVRERFSHVAAFAIAATVILMPRYFFDDKEGDSLPKKEPPSSFSKKGISVASFHEKRTPTIESHQVIRQEFNSTEKVSEKQVVKKKVESAFVGTENAGRQEKHSENTLPSIAQPEFIDFKKPISQDGDILSINESPEKPNYSTNYDETPGGEVLVIEVTIDDSGSVIDSRIAVPSKYGLEDFTLAIAIKNIKIQDVDPPLQKGELRKIGIRIPYRDNRILQP